MTESKSRVNSIDSIESIHLNEYENNTKIKTNPIKCKQNNFFSNKRQRDELRKLSKSPQIDDVIKLLKYQNKKV
tara:strand:- start:2936 stop:3157 length:222 start_codon:yes stop_codon:yes gene_type:complete